MKKSIQVGLLLMNDGLEQGGHYQNFNQSNMENQIIGISIDELQRIMKGVVRAEIETLLQTPVTGSGFAEELWDRKQAANFLGISEQTLVKLVLEERIIAQKSGRKYHFLKSSVMTFLKGKLNN